MGAKSYVQHLKEATCCCAVHLHKSKIFYECKCLCKCRGWGWRGSTEKQEGWRKEGGTNRAKEYISIYLFLLLSYQSVFILFWNVIPFPFLHNTDTRVEGHLSHYEWWIAYDSAWFVGIVLFSPSHSVLRKTTTQSKGEIREPKDRIDRKELFKDENKVYGRSMVGYKECSETFLPLHLVSRRLSYNDVLLLSKVFFFWIYI